VKHTCSMCPPPQRQVTGMVRVVLVKKIPGGEVRTEWGIHRCEEHMPTYTVGQVVEASDTGQASSVEDWTVVEVAESYPRRAVGY